MRIRFTLALSACALLMFASTASGASTNGAQVSTEHRCDTTEFGTFCIDDHIVSNFVTTPSGTIVLVGNTRFDMSLVGAGGACSFAQSGQDAFHAVFGPNISESSDRFKQEFTFYSACTGGDITVCQTVMSFHQVNGVLQFQRSTAECTEEPGP
jgi:hypothetical protein